MSATREGTQQDTLPSQQYAWDGSKPVKVLANAAGRQGVVLYDTNGNTIPLTPRTQSPTGNVMQVQIGPGDVISNIPVMLLYDHHQIHEGETFRWSAYTSSLGLNATKDVRFTVPNITIPVGVNPVNLCPHLRFEFIGSLETLVQFYEGTTFTAPGTSRTVVAMERNGTYTPKLAVHEDPTVNALGTLIWQGLITTTKSIAGDVQGSEHEFILKNNTEYCCRITSLAANNKVLQRYVWYEDLGV